MSQNFTYTVLLGLATNYMERADQPFVDMVPTFINLAENRLATDMKQQGYQTVVTGNFDLSNVIDKPAFWRETIAFRYFINGVQQDLKLRQLEYVQQYAPSPSVTGAPKFYADYDFSHFYIAPTPPTSYAFELVYFARLDPLTPTNQENWNTLNAPQALMAAMLAEAAKWCKNPKSEARWAADYASAVTGMVEENKERLADRKVVVAR